MYTISPADGSEGSKNVSRRELLDGRQLVDTSEEGTEIPEEPLPVEVEDTSIDSDEEWDMGQVEIEVSDVEQVEKEDYDLNKSQVEQVEPDSVKLEQPNQQTHPRHSD